MSTAATGPVEDEEDDPDEVVSARVDDDRVVLAWHVGSEAIASARRILGTDGSLARRVVRVFPDATTFVRREDETEAAIDEDAVVLDRIPGGARAVVSIGLRDGERFVSIAHRSIA